MTRKSNIQYFLTTALLRHASKITTTPLHKLIFELSDYIYRSIKVAPSKSGFFSVKSRIMAKKVAFLVVFYNLLFGYLHPLCGQNVNIGIPPVRNFPKKAYTAGTQNWEAAQDSRGVLYFANNEGLLQYDGNNWHCFPVSNQTVLRSVAVHRDGRIYVGAQSELGYFYPVGNGTLAYHSLAHLLPEGRKKFEDIWDIVFLNDAVFFRTNKSVFQFDGSSMTIHDFSGNLTALFIGGGHLYVQSDLQELQIFQNGKFSTALRSPILQSPITGAISWSADTLLLTTLKNGIFSLVQNAVSSWVTPVDAVIKENRIYTAASLGNDQIALGTSLNGVMIMDKSRRILQHLTKKNGLQNNNVLCTFTDKVGNLWLGLDSGIDAVILPSPFTSVIPDKELQGTGYSASICDNKLYLGVSNGVYAAHWTSYYDPDNNAIFEKIKSTDGQIWALQTVGNELLIGHHEGAFLLSKGNVINLTTESGAWTFVSLSSSYLLGGTYNGLVLFKKSGDRWVFDQKLKGLNESCRIMVKDSDGSVWVSHPYRGVYHIVWESEDRQNIRVDFYNGQHGLPSDLNNYVFQLAGKTIFGTESGLMRFDAKSDAFQVDTDLNAQFEGSGRIRYLREDRKGNIWFVGDRETGVLIIDDIGLKKTVRKRVFPELTEKLVGGFEFIYPVDSLNLFFGAEQGFIHFDAGKNTEIDSFLQVVISKVDVSGKRDTSIFGGYFYGKNGLLAEQDPATIPVLAATSNNIRFDFSATDYGDPDGLEYRVFLKGLDENWSEWSSEASRNFTNLSPGNYVFNVQARKKGGISSKISAFSFRIRPPWYANALALSLYFIGFIIIIASFLMRQRKRFETEKVQLEEQHQQISKEQQREVEQSKAALSEIQNEKLEAEIRFRDQQLATATMHLVQKGEILLSVQENLNQILKHSNSPQLQKDIQQLLNLLKSDANLDEDWEQFAFHFDQVHVDFLKRLRDQYPQLSSNDYKLCAYLHMNLSTKEIAPLMNISVRGVEMSRYRLRKRLGLEGSVNLSEFLMRF